MILDLRKARHPEHADKADALHHERPAAAVRRVLGLGQAGRVVEGPTLLLMLDAHGKGRLLESADDLELATEPFIVVGGRARQRCTIRDTLTQPDFDEHRQTALDGKVSRDPAEPQGVCE